MPTENYGVPPLLASTLSRRATPVHQGQEQDKGRKSVVESKMEESGHYGD